MSASQEIPQAPPAPTPQPQLQPSYPPAPAPVQAPATDPRRKSPLLALVLSVMPGLGQVYVGYYKRGFIHAIVVAGLISLLVALDIDALIPLAALFLAFFWLYNIIDAGRRAQLYNQALAGGSQIELPEDFEAPGLQGSLAGGAVLVVVGLVLLSNTLFGVSVDWLEQWWPVAVVGFGGYLIYKAMQERAAGGAGPDEE